MIDRCRNLLRLASLMALLAPAQTATEARVVIDPPDSLHANAFFLLLHVGAVLYGRTVLNLDTNFYFAAAGFHVPPNQFFFAPYYFLAVLALFTHLGCAAYWHLQASPPRTRAVAIALPMVVGGAISLLLVLSLAGKLQPVEVPAKYKATYARQDG